MNVLRLKLLLTVVCTAILGAGVAGALYFGSNWFFRAKHKQTKVRTMGNLGEASGEVVLAIGDEAPKFDFVNLVGGREQAIKLSEISGFKIINFWASWCEPCVEEFSAFARLIKALDGRVAFVALSADETADEASEFLKAFHSDFSGLGKVYFSWDKNKRIAKKYGVLALPETFLVSGDGHIVKRVSGFEQWDAQGVIKYFESILN